MKIVKRLMDITLSIFIIVILFPALLIMSILIKLTSKGPFLFKQERVGHLGQRFTMYKFKTMIKDAELLLEGIRHKNEVDGPIFKIKNDPRVTKVGKFLRETGLDELPQLYNILKGDMSLVGPRPPIYSEVLEYEEWQLKRLLVKPGLTCLWQIKPNRHQINFDEWVKLDLYYIDNWSLGLDVKILLKTINTVFKRTGS